MAGWKKVGFLFFRLRQVLSSTINSNQSGPLILTELFLPKKSKWVQVNKEKGKYWHAHTQLQIDSCKGIIIFIQSSKEKRQFTSQKS